MKQDGKKLLELQIISRKSLKVILKTLIIIPIQYEYQFYKKISKEKKEIKCFRDQKRKYALFSANLLVLIERLKSNKLRNQSLELQMKGK